MFRVLQHPVFLPQHLTYSRQHLPSLVHHEHKEETPASASRSRHSLQSAGTRIVRCVLGAVGGHSPRVSRSRVIITGQTANLNVITGTLKTRDTSRSPSSVMPTFRSLYSTCYVSSISRPMSCFYHEATLHSYCKSAP